MQFQEEIYTSAAELLEGGGGSNLGIVARTRAFPRELEAELGFHRTYTMLPSLPLDDPARHPPRFILVARGPGRRQVCLSRIVFAGADHTGRTTPLAHHMIFDRGQMERAGITPALLLAGNGSMFRDRWREAPSWIEPPREFLPRSIAETLMRDPAWDELIEPRTLAVALATAAETLLRFDQSKKPVVFVLPLASGRMSAQLIANVLSLMPTATQHDLGCVTHIVETGDSFNDVALLQTYPDTPYLNANRQRRDPRAPLILDLSNPASLPADARGPYAAVMLEALTGKNPGRAVADALEAFQALGFSPDQAAQFRIAWQLHIDMPRANALTDLDELAQRLDGVRPVPNPALLTQWAVEMVNERVAKWPAPLCWNGLGRVASDARWPMDACNVAAEAIAANAATALPCILRGVQPGSDAAATLRSLVKQIIREDPKILADAMEQVLSGPADGEHFAIVESLLAAAPLPEFAVSLEWSRRLTSASQAVREALLSKVREFVNKAATTTDRLSLLRSLADNASFRQQVYIPILQERLVDGARKGGSSAWSSYAKALIQAAIADGDVAREVRWLASYRECRALIIPQLAKDWIALARRTHGEDLTELFRELGISSSSPVAAPPMLEILPESDFPETPAEPHESSESNVWSQDGVPTRRGRRSAHQGAGWFSRALYLAIPAILAIVNLLLASMMALPAWDSFPRPFVLAWCVGIPILWVVAFFVIRFAVADFNSSWAKLLRIFAPILLLASLASSGVLILCDPGLGSRIERMKLHSDFLVPLQGASKK